MELKASAVSVYVPAQPGDQTYNENRRLTASSLFEPDGTYVGGNLREIPYGLPFDAKSHLVKNIERDGGGGARPAQIVMVASRLQDGRTN